MVQIFDFIKNNINEYILEKLIIYLVSIPANYLFDLFKLNK